MRMRRFPRGSFMVKYISLSSWPTIHGEVSSLNPQLYAKALDPFYLTSDCSIPLLAVVLLQIPQRSVSIIGVEGLPIGEGELPESVCLLGITQWARIQGGSWRAFAGNADDGQRHEHPRGYPPSQHRSHTPPRSPSRGSDLFRSAMSGGYPKHSRELNPCQQTFGSSELTARSRGIEPHQLLSP